MINVSSKNNSLRYARAEGFLNMKPETIDLIKSNNIPKGDVLATARATGISTAKKTSDLAVFCHPIPLDWVDVKVDVIPQGLHIIAEAEAVWKTGVEMEAIGGVLGALLNAYDMLKPLDQDLEITAVRVVEKRGGKSQFVDIFETPLKTAILVISDSTHAGKRKDRSGQIIKEILHDQPVSVEIHETLPDNLQLIRKRVVKLVKEGGFDLIITTGGTGFGPKDFTPEAIDHVLDKSAPGIVERMRAYGSERTPYAMLSREIAGTIGSSLVLTLPGSSKGAKESMQALFPGVLHLFPVLWGGGHKNP
jgi:molybdenum cofactor biosynthesis protein MoaC